MSLISLSVQTLIRSEWDYKLGTVYSNNIYFKANPKDTYMIVFGYSQERQFNMFNKDLRDKFNILYESPKAYNKQHGGYEPRNTLIIFESKDEPATV